MAKARQIVLGLLAVSAVCMAAERPNREWMTLFQEAQYQEQTAGDLDKAIELYEQVLTEAADVERLAARAAFQLGVCHQKKGDAAKAADYFRQVVSKYPGQKELVVKAQKQLEKIMPASSQALSSYVIHYKAIDQSQDALELLNTIHPKGVRTFRANRYRANGETIDSICTDTEESKNKLVAAINNSSSTLKLVKVESQLQMTDVYKQKLEQPVTVNVATSPDGDRLTIQYAAIAIAEAAGVPYQWDKSAKLADPQMRNYIEPVHVDGNIASQALADLLGPVGLTYKIEPDGIYLYDPQKGIINLEILGINFTPISQGKNYATITVQNVSTFDQLFAIHIYTRSTDYGTHGVGWGTRFFESIPANETKSLKFPYKIQGPITPNTYLRLKFYNPISREDYDYEKPFQTDIYPSNKLPQITKEPNLTSVSSDIQNQIIHAFNSFRSLIEKGQYETAWGNFTEDFQKTEYQNRGIDAFKRHMQPQKPLDAAFSWPKNKFLNLKPQQLLQIESETTYILETTIDSEIWRIYYQKEGNMWKIDWISGYTPEVAH